MVFFLLVWLPSLIHFPLLALYFRKEDIEEGRKLQASLPQSATLVIDTDLESTLPVTDLKPGYLIRIEPGEVVPVDAAILTGSGFFDESALGGEEAKSKGVGAGIYAGAINKNGRIIGRTLRSFHDSKINTIIQQRLEDKASASLLLLSFFLGLLPFCFSRHLHQFLLGLLFCSPSVLFLSQIIPYRITRGHLRELGLFFRNETEMNAAARIDAVVFDPFLSLTASRPTIESIQIAKDGWDENRILTFAFGLTRYDDAPLSFSLTQLAKEKQLIAFLVNDWKKENGILSAEVDELPVELKPSTWQGKRALSLFSENILCGTICFSDTQASNANDCFQSLKKLSIAPIASSEAPRGAVEYLCEGLELHHIYADATPSEQVELEKKLAPLKVRRLPIDESIKSFAIGVSLIRKKCRIQKLNWIFAVSYLLVGSILATHATWPYPLLPSYLLYQLFLFTPIVNAMQL